MAYTLEFALALGAGNTGLTLEAQLVSTTGTNVGAAITTGFVEFGATGNYLWNATALPDAHRGGVVFQVSPGGAIKAFAAINPEEGETSDVKTSTRSSHSAADVWAAGTRTLTSFGTLVADVTTSVWAAGTRTLTSFGTLVADVATAVWSAVSRTLTSAAGISAADVWTYVSRTLTSGAAPSAAVVADAVWDEPRADHLLLGSFGIADQVVRDGQAQAGSATTLTLDAGASAVDDFYTNDVIFLKVGTGAGQVNIISDYVGATKVATLLQAWVVTPDSSTCFVIIPLALIPGASNLSAANIWAYATRTLTQAIAAVTPPPLITGDAVAVLRGETLALLFTGLGDISARTKLWFTVKGNKSRPDTAAIIQIEETDGLLYLNGAVATPAEGSITVTDAVTGALTVGLVEEAAALLVPSDRYYYDIQMLSPAGVATLTSGSFSIAADVTRDVS